MLYYDNLMYIGAYKLKQIIYADGSHDPHVTKNYSLLFEIYLISLKRQWILCFCIQMWLEKRRRFLLIDDLINGNCVEFTRDDFFDDKIWGDGGFIGFLN
jgi:hypothetical protein